MFRVISRVFNLQNLDKNKNEHEYHHEPKIKIDEKDIIEADYEDLTPPKQN